MKGFRVMPKGCEKVIDSCQLMINDLLRSGRAYDIMIFKKKHKAWFKKHGRPTAKKISGYHSFITENTKVV